MIFLLCLLIAAPEKVVMVARPHEKPGLIERASRAVASGWHRLFEKEEAHVAQGNAAFAEGEPDKALQSYDAVKDKLPDSPELAYDRSTALSKGDPRQAPEAASEALRALTKGDASLKEKAAYQLGVSQEAMGKPEDAMKSYAAALSMNPDDEDAKVNLELLLKTQEEKKQQQQQQQQSQKKEKQDQKDQQQNQQQGKQEQQEQKPQQGEEKQQEKQEQQAKQEEKKEQQPEEKPVDRSEAERLLDALRASEKNLQSWRFAKEKRKNAPPPDVEKDW